ncbi:MAG: hypothetical protein VB140_04115 [Burkholderia sp.]
MLHKSSVRTQCNGLWTSLVRNPFVSPEIMPVDAIASSRSIYGTTSLEITVFGLQLLLHPLCHAWNVLVGEGVHFKFEACPSCIFWSSRPRHTA